MEIYIVVQDNNPVPNGRHDDMLAAYQAAEQWVAYSRKTVHIIKITSHHAATIGMVLGT